MVEHGLEVEDIRPAFENQRRHRVPERTAGPAFAGARGIGIGPHQVQEMIERERLAGIGVVEQANGDWYEHAVLVTSWEQSDVRVLAQAYRDRADAENMFDELKNPWGWTGYTTKDLNRSQLMARLVALAYNWWGIYTRIGTGPTHREAITTRPALMEGVAQQTEHARTVKLRMTSVNGKEQRIGAL